MLNVNDKKEENLAYGGSALIEGIMMRGKNGYAITIKKENGELYKEKTDYTAIGKKYSILGLPFIRGIVGFIENMIIGIKVLNKSAEIAMPDEDGKPVSNLALFMTFAVAMLIAAVIFIGIPRFIPLIFKLDVNVNPFLYNFISAVSRFALFFMYLIFISFMKDTKRLFGYHGAEHKTIHTYENETELNVENVSKNSRLHPRCGTSFIFIVLLIIVVIFPFFDIMFIKMLWYKNLTVILGPGLGKIAQNIFIILMHVVIGMPVVASISYELLKISGKFYKNFLVKILVAPGLGFQLFTTREPDESMIKVGILSLNMVLGKEDVSTPRIITGDISPVLKPIGVVTAIFLLPILLFNFVFNTDV